MLKIFIFLHFYTAIQQVKRQLKTTFQKSERNKKKIE